MCLSGSFASAGSQIASGVQAKKQGETNAKRLEAQGQDELALRRRRSRFLIGEQRSRISAGGVSLASPTAIDVLAATASFEEMAAQRAADPYRYEARAQKTRGSQAMGAAGVGAGSSLLSGASMFVTRRG